VEDEAEPIQILEETLEPLVDLVVVEQVELLTLDLQEANPHLQVEQVMQTLEDQIQV
jgi:hypothetical protein